jgi:hypothetical protein
MMMIIMMMTMMMKMMMSKIAKQKNLLECTWKICQEGR